MEDVILFTKWSKGAVSVVGVFAVLLFTITANVAFDPATGWAGDGRDAAGETADASKEAKGKLSGAADSATGFIGGIFGWIKGVTDSINKMWGMENGGGMASATTGLFYVILIGGFLFGGKMLINIVKGAVGGKVDERYQKPTFRKK